MKRIAFLLLNHAFLVACGGNEKISSQEQSFSDSYKMTCSGSVFIVHPNEFYNIDGSAKYKMKSVTMKDGFIRYTAYTDIQHNPLESFAIDPDTGNVFSGSENLQLERKCKASKIPQESL